MTQTHKLDGTWVMSISDPYNSSTPFETTPLDSLESVHFNLKSLSISGLAFKCDLSLYSLPKVEKPQTRVSIVRIEPQKSTELFMLIIEHVLQNCRIYHPDHPVVMVSFSRNHLNFALHIDFLDYSLVHIHEIITHLNDQLRPFIADCLSEQHYLLEFHALHTESDESVTKKIQMKNTADSVANTLRKMKILTK